MKKYQELAGALYILRGYRATTENLALGLCEEAGELAKAVNLLSSTYIPKEGYEAHDVEHEIYDCLMYILHLANNQNIEIDLDGHLNNKLDMFGHG